MNALKNRLRRTDNYVLALILLVAIVFMSIANDRFLTLGAFQSMASQFPEMGILTLAMMAPMITGGINLASISTANLAGILMATWMHRAIPTGYDSPSLVALIVAAGILLCVLITAINGVIIAWFNVPPILATLSAGIFITGICLAITRGGIISGFPRSFQFIGNGRIGIIPTPLVVFIICAVIMVIVLRYTQMGPQSYMYGSNSTAVEFSGVQTKILLVKVYALSGFFVGVAAVLLTSRFNSAAAGYAASYLLLSVLVAVMGGISPNGGTGRVSGLVLSVLLLQVVASGLNFMRVSQFLTMALYGVLLLVAMAVRSRRLA